jgi:membrane protease YdiL (CAAX protease family)
VITEQVDAKRIAVCAWGLAFAAWLAWCYHFSAANSAAFVFHLAVGVPILALADEQWRSWAQRHLPASWRGGAVIWTSLLGLVVVTAAPAQRADPTFTLIWAAYLALPIAAFAIASSRVRLIVGSAVIVLPVGLLPMVKLTVPGRDPLSFGVLIIVDLALTLVLLYRPDERVRYSLWLSKRDTLLATTAFLGYAIVALPLGLLLGFMRPGLGEPTVATALGRLVELYFFVAIAEELVGRAFLQNGLERVIGNTWGLCAAAAIFGIAHVGHAPAPNWRYVLLATGAGLVYGWVYQKTRSITASALTHVLVDWTWFVFFAGVIGK